MKLSNLVKTIALSLRGTFASREHEHSVDEIADFDPSSKADTSTSIAAGTGLTGGGNLTANRSISVVFGTAAGTVTEGNDSRLSDSREWTASTVSQTEAEAGSATTRRAWTAQRVFQAAAAWWSGSSAKTKLDSIATTANTYLRRNGDNDAFVAVTPQQVADEVKPLLALGSAADADIVGIVSESSGVPTGAIIERGSNANGEYVRYADGTQICWRIIEANDLNLPEDLGDFEFPAAFTGVVCNSAFVSVRTSVLTLRTGLRVSIGASADQYLRWESVLIGDLSGNYSNQSVFVRLFAFGRWF